MADLKITPGILNVTKVFRDGLFMELDFNLDLSEYTFAASVINAVTKAETTITVTPIDLAAGQLKLTMTPETASAVPVGKHTWAFRWTPPGPVPPEGTLRTILGGTFEVTA